MIPLERLYLSSFSLKQEEQKLGEELSLGQVIIDTNNNPTEALTFYQFTEKNSCVLPGTCQGFPLLHILFVLTIEPLNCVIAKKPNIQGHYTPKLCLKPGHCADIR